MKAVIQRVTRAAVHVDGKTVGQIKSGLLILLGVAKGDGESDGRYLVQKICTLRIFSDEDGKMNRSLVDIGGSVLLISQFTLMGRTANGRRPSFEEAAPPEEAKRLYELVEVGFRRHGTYVETGVFAAHMQVELLNDGPVTFVLDSRGSS
ncbi:MAG TPA: D-aminoacyl-tRNA deacylase [Nitrospiraceae bacterium]|nr:D-aminoacyl-tRNA deacylase [Nitrospiraceae bacterium]